MRQIVGNIIRNKASGGKWLISEDILDTVRLYVYCSIDEVDEVPKAEFYHIVEEKDGLVEDR